MTKERRVINENFQIGSICQDNSGRQFEVAKIVKNSRGKTAYVCKYLISKNEYIKENFDIKYGEVSDFLGIHLELIGKEFNSKEDGIFTVISLEKNDKGVLWYNIKFKETGNIYCVRKSNLLKGGVGDSKKSILKIGSEFSLKNNKDSVIVISEPRYSEDRRYSYYKIQSKNYPQFIKEAEKRDIINGVIVNPLIPDHFGRYLGIGEYSRMTHKELYNKWYDIFERINKAEDYKGVKISPYFCNFQNFCAFCLKQINQYNPAVVPYLEGDKDYLFFIKKLSERQYSEETYLLIPKRLNRYLIGLYKEPNLSFIEKGITKYRVLKKNKYKRFDNYEEALKYWLEVRQEEFNYLLLENHSILPKYHYDILSQFNIRDAYNWYHGTNY